MLIYIVILFGLAISLINFFSENLYIKNGHRRTQAKTFAAGISVTYIFLHLLPRALPQNNPGELFYASILIGFVIFNLFEMHIYQSKDIQKRKKELKEEHAFSFFMYNYLIGMALYFFFTKNVIQGILFSVPVALHNLLSATSLREMHSMIKKNWFFRILLSITPILGILSAYLISFPDSFYRMIIGLITGSLMYIVFRELIPMMKSKSSNYFVIGMLTMIGFLMIDFMA